MATPSLSGQQGLGAGPCPSNSESVALLVPSACRFENATTWISMGNADLEIDGPCQRTLQRAESDPLWAEQ